jgi:hypothetical protein
MRYHSSPGPSHASSPLAHPERRIQTARNPPPCPWMRVAGFPAVGSAATACLGDPVSREDSAQYLSDNGIPPLSLDSRRTDTRMEGSRLGGRDASCGRRHRCGWRVCWCSRWPSPVSRRRPPPRPPSLGASRTARATRCCSCRATAPRRRRASPALLAHSRSAARAWATPRSSSSDATAPTMDRWSSRPRPTRPTSSWPDPPD